MPNLDSLTFLDWFKKQVIAAIFSDEFLSQILVLKGGNLLDIVFQVSTRSSQDLDFSIETDQQVDWLRQRIESALKSRFAIADFVVFDVRIFERPPNLSDDIRDFWGGYKVEFKLIEREKFAQHQHDLDALRRNAVAVGKLGSTKFALDISRHEYCGEKQRFQMGDVPIYGYSPEMSLAEKLRAICQQMPAYRETVRKHLAGRARDFIDIHDISEAYLINFAFVGFHETIRRVFDAKRVPMSLLGKIGEYREDHRGDFVSVQATVKPGVQLQDFDYYVDYVLRSCRDLEPLWDV